MIGTLHGWEIVLLVLAAVVILGPSRLPEYAARLAHGVRWLRDLAEGAKGQIKEELGPGFEDVDWRQLDPRQYDPRRIVREALATPPSSTSSSPGGGAGGPAARQDAPGGRVDRGPVGSRVRWHDPDLPTPFDVDAT